MANRKTVTPKSFEGIYKRLEEVILANSGENEFEEIFKLVILKLWNEIYNEIYEKEIKKADKKLKVIDNEWKGVLKGTFFNITNEQYVICMTILNGISFLETGYEGIDSIFEFLISREKKGVKGQYFTPRYLVDFCTKIINPKAGEVVLDPAAGSGAFLYHTYINNPDIMPKDLWGFDFDHIAVRIAKLLMYVAELNGAHIYRVNSLVKNNKAAEGENITTIEDIMRIEKQKGLFDVIMTNPPFAGEITEVEILKSYMVSKNKVRIERDVLFIERCIDLLKPNGRMSIVLPDNIFSGKDTVELRKWIDEQCRIVGVIGIPRNTFMPHTSVKTSILFLQKREKKEKMEEKIFFGISERAGKDSRGNIQYRSENHVWAEVDHDLEEIYNKFYSFMKEERIGW